MRTYPLFITAGPMAGQIIPASEDMIEKARAGGYGMRPGDRSQGLEGVPPKHDRSKPHKAGQAFAAAYADRQIRAAMYSGEDPMTAARATAAAEAMPQTSGYVPGLVPDGGKRKRGRPPGGKGGRDE
jgi:hypothetical protein